MYTRGVEYCHEKLKLIEHNSSTNPYNIMTWLHDRQYLALAFVVDDPCHIIRLRTHVTTHTGYINFMYFHAVGLRIVPIIARVRDATRSPAAAPAALY